MDLSGYIHEITRMRSFPSAIDKTDHNFLWHILDGRTSTYQIYSKLKEDGTPMAYKNAHRRIKKLFESNLIEEIKTKGGFKHGARNYRLATRGLIYVFSELIVPHEKSIFLSYSENILFRTFLYPYFERNTIESATYSLYRLIRNYLEQSSQMTKQALEMTAAYLTEYPFLKSSEMLELVPIQILQYQLNWHIRSFILKTAIMTEDLIDWRFFYVQPDEQFFPSSGKIRCAANDRIDTFALLSGDKKYMKALEEIGRQFREGHDKLIELKHNKKKSK